MTLKYSAYQLQNINLIRFPEHRKIIFLHKVKYLVFVMRTKLLASGPGWFSRYGDPLQAVMSENRIPVEARFSAPVETGTGAHTTSYTLGTGCPFRA